MANANLKIDEKIGDCKTNKYFTITVEEDLANLLVERYYIEGTSKLKKITDPKEILNKTIKLRTPLYCKSEIGICPICYGDTWKILNSSNIGILAGGAINVVGIEALMKMRHKSSSVSTKEVDFIKIIKKSGMDINLLTKYFEINKTKIIPKQNCVVYLNEKDYDDKTLIDCGDKFQLPGMINVNFGTAPDYVSIFLPINIIVSLIKPNSDNYNTEKNTITLYYETGELMIEQDFYSDMPDERIVSRLFEGGAKYLTNPEILTMALHDKLTEINLVHIEAIVSNMFRDEKDLNIPARLTTYKNAVILGQKAIPFETSWLNSLAFENINRAIKTGLLNGKDAIMDPIEKIILDKYYNE